MPQGKGKASSGRRRSSDGYPYDNRPRPPFPHSSVSQNVPSESNMDQGSSAPSSNLDASIPFNLPARRSMKMLKDGSDFVWPDAAHSLFVRGLQAWKFLNMGSKRTRAPRGEGKTDFLVQYLQSHGIERTKKQVASHLQVLRTEWRNMDNTVLLSLVDETISHTRSLSEPSLPPPSISFDSSSSTSVFNSSPDPSDDRSTSTPALPSPIPAVSPTSSSSLFHPAHNIYGGRPRSFPTMAPGEPLRAHTRAYVESWQLDNSVWNTPVARTSLQQAGSFPQSPSRYPSSSATLPEYEHHAKPLNVPRQDSYGFSSKYYHTPGHFSTYEGLPSSVGSHSQTSHSLASLPLIEANNATIQAPISYIPASPYDSYNPGSSYPLSQQSAPHNAYDIARTSYGTEPYQSQLNSGERLRGADSLHTMIAGSASYDVVEPGFHTGVQEYIQPHWAHSRATYPHAPDTPELDRNSEF